MFKNTATFSLLALLCACPQDEPTADAGATPTADAAVAADTGITPNADAAEPLADAGIVVPGDAGITPTADAGPAADAGPEGPSIGCTIGSTWTINLVSAATAEAGDGCRDDGAPAQSAATHILEVVEGSNGQPTFEVRSPNTGRADHVAIEGSFSEDRATCSLTGFVEIGMNFPPQGDDTNPTQSRFRYNYSIGALAGVISGTGSVSYRYLVMPAATDHPVRQPCTETLVFSGTAEN